jgi:hypothetical protein
LINLPDVSNLNGLMNQVQSTAAKSSSNPNSFSLFGHFSTASLLIGLLAGLFGSAYFMYGKRQANFSVLLTGVALWVVPFFITSVLWLSLACGALVFAPFIIARFI